MVCGYASSAKAGTVLHYTANTHGTFSAPQADGFNVFDVAGSPDDPASTGAKVNALPAGTMALIWVGNLDNAPMGSKCPAPGFTMAQFQAQVDALAHNAKVYGYYLSDEPHPSVCPNAAADIRARADYIHAHTSQKSFIVVLDGYNMCTGYTGCEYKAFAPANTHVDLIGLDPYPCHYDKNGKAVSCDVSQITTKVRTAIQNGISANSVVPVFQTFGQEGRTDSHAAYYRTPTAAEMRSMLAVWHSVIPHPVMDYSYSYGVQCTYSTCPASRALSNTPELNAIMRAHNTQTDTP